jgi:hypothetical protein
MGLWGFRFRMRVERAIRWGGDGEEVIDYMLTNTWDLGLE